jgi:pyruvate carboxylase
MFMGITIADIKEIDMINAKLVILSSITLNITNGSMKRNSDSMDNGINIQTKIIPASVTYETLENTRLK